MKTELRYEAGMLQSREITVVGTYSVPTEWEDVPFADVLSPNTDEEILKLKIRVTLLETSITSLGNTVEFLAKNMNRFIGD